MHWAATANTVIMDAGLLMGDDPYRYPDNLPIVNAKGGPGGKPSCGSLPDVSKNYPVKYLVTDTWVRRRPRYPAQSRDRLPRYCQLLSRSPRQYRNRRRSGTPAALHRVRCRPTPAHLLTAHRSTGQTERRSTPPPPARRRRRRRRDSHEKENTPRRHTRGVVPPYCAWSPCSFW